MGAVKPRLLDLFCGAGGAAVGYHRAGFDVIGVDIAPQPRYPYEFEQADAIELMGTWIKACQGWWDVPAFDAIHASPPCQFYTQMGKAGHQRLIPKTRDLLEQTGLPFVIENVPDARWDMADDSVMLCGSMFDPVLGVKRHRLFEANWPLRHPDWPCRHQLAGKRFRVFEHGKWRLTGFAPVYGNGGRKSVEHWPEAMGIDWMTRDELSEAIPPAYTEFIGAQLLAHLKVAA